MQVSWSLEGAVLTYPPSEPHSPLDHVFSLLTCLTEPFPLILGQQRRRERLRGPRTGPPRCTGDTVLWSYQRNFEFRNPLCQREPSLVQTSPYSFHLVVTKEGREVSGKLRRRKSWRTWGRRVIRLSWQRRPLSEPRAHSHTDLCLSVSR